MIIKQLISGKGGGGGGHIGSTATWLMGLVLNDDTAPHRYAAWNMESEGKNVGKWEDERAVAKPVKRGGHGKTSLKNLHRYNVGFPSPCRTHIANAQQISIPCSGFPIHTIHNPRLGEKKSRQWGVSLFSFLKSWLWYKKELPAHFCLPQER